MPTCFVELRNIVSTVTEHKSAKQTFFNTGIGSHWNILPHQAACLMETIMAPLIFILETWIANQDNYNDSGNILRYKPGL